MDGMDSNVRFTSLETEEADEWAGDQSVGAVAEGELGGKGRKRASAGTTDVTFEDDSGDDDDRTDNDATTSTDEDYEKDR